jgi:hypothetical protein
MDPVTTAILGAIAAGVLSGLNATVGKAVGDAYAGLKSLIARRAGRADVTDAIAALESKPDSAGRRATVEEEIAAAGLDRDDEVLAAARKLIEELGLGESTGQVTQQASGTGIAQAAYGSSASVQLPPPGS